MKIENLKQLFESSVLNEETKEVLSTVFEEAVKSKEQELETQFQAKLVEEMAKYEEEVRKNVQEAVAEEIEAIGEELTHARALEVKYAEKLQQFKESYTEKQAERTRVMVEEAIAEELGELKEEIELAKKHEFVMQVYESFAGVYSRLFGGTDISIADQLEETQKELAALKHEKKLNELLEGVTGNKREVAKTILESVSYDKLESRFESIKGILLAEKADDSKQLEESEGVKPAPTGKVILESFDDSKDENIAPSRIESRLARSLQYAGVR